MSQRPEDPGESYLDRYQRQEAARRVREYARLDRDQAAARAARGGDGSRSTIWIAASGAGCAFLVLSLLFVAAVYWLVR